MKTYLNLLEEILENGSIREDRTGTGTKGIFGHQAKYDLLDGFPLLTTKKLHLKSILYELLWFLNGDTNIKYLQDNGVKIWDAWADKNGDLGPIYGKQWRDWNGDGIDQITNLISEIKNNPSSRRLIVSGWNPSILPDTKKSFEENVSNGKAALPPCHALFQFYVNNGELSCQLYQRSADCFLGVPFNIASYSLLTMMIAQVCGLKAKEFIHTLGDAHIYTNHIEQCKEQISRTTFKAPKMTINPDVKDIFSFKYEDFVLSDYESHPHIKGNISV